MERIAVARLGEGYGGQFDDFVVKQMIDDDRRGEYLHHLFAIDAGGGPYDFNAVRLAQRAGHVGLIFYSEGAPENESIIHT